MKKIDHEYDQGAMGTIKGKRSIAGALNTIPKIKHLKNAQK